MASIVAHNASVEFILYEGSARSFKKTAFHTAVGGLIGHSQTSRTSIHALRDATFSFQNGDRVGLIGHNGSGKTTLLRALAGIYHPTAGSIAIDGRCVPLFDLALGMDEEATGYETILLRGLFMGLDRHAIAQRSADIEEFSGLGEFLTLPVRTYSSGMIFRLLFSIAVTIEAEILLMDEWIAVGDAEFRERANTRLRETIQRAKIMVFASHDFALLRSICNRAILLESGRILAEGDVEDVIAKYLARAAGP